MLLHVSTVAQNGQTSTLALESQPFAFLWHHRSSYMLGKGRGDGGVFRGLQSATLPLDATKSYTMHL